jgi:hypothetical protein
VSKRANFATTYLYSKEVSGKTSRNIWTPKLPTLHPWKDILIFKKSYI